MSTTLPAPASTAAALATASAAVSALDGPVPSSVRAKALRAMPAGLKALRQIIRGDSPGGTKVYPSHVVAAVKLQAQIAAVLATASVPRDVVDERIRRTAGFLRTELGDARYAALADGLSAIWDF